MAIITPDHPSHAKPGIHPLDDKLYVVTMLSNPLRWRSRYWNFWAFERACEAAGAELYVAEIAYGDREYEVTDGCNPKHLQLRTRHELWHKENALNLLIQRLPKHAKYIAWIDADVEFVRPDWAQETMHMLQHYDFIQMFSHAQDIGPDYEPLEPIFPGFMYQYKTRSQRPDAKDMTLGHINDYYSWWGHPGYAWAARKDALEKVGMLIDWAACGSGDWHMSTALVGEVDFSLTVGYGTTYGRLCREWQARCERHIRRNVGYMNGLVNHLFHGSKKKRHYGERSHFLATSGFDPETDLRRDSNGLWQLTEGSMHLRDGIRNFSRMRNEDSVDV